MKFEDLTQEQLWQLRQEICVNDIFVNHYSNSFNFDENNIYDFFDGYYDYLWELASEDGKKTHEEVMEYDTPDNLYSWFNCSDDLSWVKTKEDEEC